MAQALPHRRYFFTGNSAAQDQSHTPCRMTEILAIELDSGDRFYTGGWTMRSPDGKPAALKIETRKLGTFFRWSIRSGQPCQSHW